MIFFPIFSEDSPDPFSVPGPSPGAAPGLRLPAPRNETETKSPSLRPCALGAMLSSMGSSFPSFLLVVLFFLLLLWQLSLLSVPLLVGLHEWRHHLLHHA